VLKYFKEPTIRDEKSDFISKAAILLISAIIHAAAFYLLLHARFNYRIYRYDKSGAATVVLLPRDAVPFPKAPKGGAPALRGPEPLIVKPGRTTQGAAAVDAKATAGEKPAPKEPAGEAAGKPGALVGPPGAPPGEKGVGSGGEGKAPSPGISSEFTLTYPLGSQLKLSKPPETSIDEILRPGRYRNRSDINFSTYLRPEPGAMAPSGRIGVGRSAPGGGGGGAQGQGRGSRVTLNVARYDLTGWASGVMNKIQKNWTIDNPEDTVYKVEVRIAVMMARNGDLLAVEIETPSKVDALDQAALRALQASGPFPPLPADFPKSSLDMVFVFQYGY
jgi:TonB family protein